MAHCLVQMKKPSDVRVLNLFVLLLFLIIAVSLQNVLFNFSHKGQLLMKKRLFILGLFCFLCGEGMLAQGAQDVGLVSADGDSVAAGVSEGAVKIRVLRNLGVDPRLSDLHFSGTEKEGRFTTVDEYCDDMPHYSDYLVYRNIIEYNVMVGDTVWFGVVDPGSGYAYSSVTDLPVCVMALSHHSAAYGQMEADAEIPQTSVDCEFGPSPLPPCQRYFIMPDADVVFVQNWAVPMSVSKSVQDSGPRVYAGPSTLMVECDGMCYSVFAENGTLVYTGSDYAVSLNPGAYFVKLGDGSSVKVLVP